jgi:hypothetical protein
MISTRTRSETDIVVPAELWGTSILPEGLLERWIFADDTLVEAGDPVAAIRIEGALHNIMAPARGRLQISLRSNTVVEPGSTIGAISRRV